MSEEKRYIDIEKLIPEMKQESLKMFNSYYKGFVEAIKMIADFPVEDVAPVVHGHWIDIPTEFYEAWQRKFGNERFGEDCPVLTEDDIACSECLTKFDVICNCTEEFDYCPSCGAKMDEEVK